MPLALFLVRERQSPAPRGSPSTIRGSICTSRGTSPRAPASPTTPGADGRVDRSAVDAAPGAAAFCWATSRWPRRSGSRPRSAPRVVTRRAALAWGASPAAAPLGRSPCCGPGQSRGARSPGWKSPWPRRSCPARCWPGPRSAVRGRGFASLAVLARPESVLMLPLLLLARPMDIGGSRRSCSCPRVVLRPCGLRVGTVGRRTGDGGGQGRGRSARLAAGTHEPSTTLLFGRPWDFAREWIALARRASTAAAALLPAFSLAWRRSGRALGVAGWPCLHTRSVWPGSHRIAGPAFRRAATRSTCCRSLLLVLAVAFDATPARLRRPVLALWLALALWTLVPAAERYAWGVENIEAMQVKLGHWVDTNFPPPRAGGQRHRRHRVRLAARGHRPHGPGDSGDLAVPAAGRGRSHPLRDRGCARST